MPLIWTDDFESYTAGVNVPAPWINQSNAPISIAQAHGGTKSLAAGPLGAATTAMRPLGSNVSQWYIDFWMWTNSVGGATTGNFVSLISNPSFTQGPAVTVAADGSGRCGLATTGTVWFTFTVSTNTWHHYLLEITTAVAGTAKLTVDGTVAGTFSGDTRDILLGTFVSHVVVGGQSIGPAPPAEMYVDDISVSSGVFVPGAGTQARAIVLA